MFWLVHLDLKTTCARVAAGLIEADAGHASIDARLVSSGDVGICFQRPQDQLLQKSVAEDIALVHLTKGFSPMMLRSFLRSRTCWLRSAESRVPPLTLSGGQSSSQQLCRNTLPALRMRWCLMGATSGLDGKARLQTLHLARRVGK